MTLYDVSITISQELPTWPGDPPIKLKKLRRISEGELANVTHLSAGVHIGTHVDAPDHFLDNGVTVEDLPLNLLVGGALLVEHTGQSHIKADDLKQLSIPPGIQRLLIKTSNSDWWSVGENQFQEGYLALTPEAAEYLVELGIQLVGLDYLSVAPYPDPEPTHRILLEAGILILEGLDLSAVNPGPYRLYCLPLKIKGSDGAPARVLLES
jgi:arylformamidase